MRPRYSRVLIALVTLLLLTPAVAQQPEGHRAVLWTDPGDIRSKDLFYGPGGKEGQPKLPLRFDKEKSGGASPKFDVKDAAGEKWHVKLGPEAHPEPIASRLLWAVGYFANINYFIHDLPVEGLPQHLGRGSEFVERNGTVIYGRIQRKLGKDEKTWSWRHNPFVGTREFNGLRVMMALLRDWDLKDVNNAVYEDKRSGRLVYLVTDVGATFGTTGESYTTTISKGYLKAFRSGKFISKVTPEYVDFNFPTHPPFYNVFNLPLFVGEMRDRWVGKKVPRDDVRWIASLLSQLSRRQIEDAFRAGGFQPDQVQQYADILQQRIAALAKL